MLAFDDLRALPGVKKTRPSTIYANAKPLRTSKAKKKKKWTF